MRMARYDDLSRFRSKAYVQLSDVVQDMDRDPRYGHMRRNWNGGRPFARIVVPSNRIDRRNALEGVKHGFAADITGMNNGRGALQCGDRFRAHQPVCIGDNPNERHTAFCVNHGR